MDNRIEIPVCGSNGRQMAVIDKGGTRGNTRRTFYRAYLFVNLIYDFSTNLPFPLDLNKT